MILEKLLGFFGNVFLTIINVFNIPGLPDDVLEGAREFLDTLFTNASLIGLFVKINTIKSVALLLIIIYNFQHIWNVTKWLISKIPFLNK